MDLGCSSFGFFSPWCMEAMILREYHVFCEREIHQNPVSSSRVELLYPNIRRHYQRHCHSVVILRLGLALKWSSAHLELLTSHKSGRHEFSGNFKKILLHIVCSKANILPEVSETRGGGRALQRLVARSLLGNNARARQRQEASWKMRRRWDMKPLCLGAWKEALLKDNHDLACKLFPGKEHSHQCVLCTMR